MTFQKHKKLGQILIETGLITPEALDECLSEQKWTKEFLGKILLKKNFIHEKDLMKGLSLQFNIPWIELKRQYVNWQVCQRFSSLVAHGSQVVPIGEDEDNVIVAISDPLNVLSLGKIEEISKPKKIKLVLVCESELKELVSECKKRNKSILKSIFGAE